MRVDLCQRTVSIFKKEKNGDLFARGLSILKIKFQLIPNVV